MRFHVLGVGSIGTLIAFHLKRTLRLARNPQNLRALPSPVARAALPDPHASGVTLHLRRNAFAKDVFKNNPSALVVESGGVRQVERGAGVEVGFSPTQIATGVVYDRRRGVRDPQGRRTGGGTSVSDGYRIEESGGVSITSQSGYGGQDAIDSIIVTTKADSTLGAIRQLGERITPATTIVLMQNGMGVLDTLLQRLFRDPQQRPNFILASATHGAWQKGPLETVHAAMGSIHFGVVPDARAGPAGYERMLDTRYLPQATDSFDETGTRAGLYDYSTQPQGDGKEPGGWDTFSPRSARSEARRAARTAARGARSAVPQLDIAGIPDVSSTRTLRATIGTLLALPLDVHWEPIRVFQLRALRKLVVNACINPLTALADCRNGDLFGNAAAMAAMRDICREASLVLTAQARAAAEADAPATAGFSARDLLTETDENGQPTLDASLRPSALQHEVLRVARITAANWSSMHQDIKRRRPTTEVEYMNGYLSSLGAAHGVPTPINDMLVHLVNLKTTRTSGTWKTSGGM